MVYMGGMGAYTDELHRIANEGYDGLDLGSSALQNA
jgi:hypothetical protein